MRLIRRTLFALCGAVILACTAAPASGQYLRSASDPATGERYNIELSGGFWSPTVQGIISSESLGIAGTDIDFVDDLGFLDTRFPEFRAVLRPGKKHKFRAAYVPIKYEAESTLRRNVVFNGIVFPVAVPVRSTLDWKAWRLGYEYDFIYRDRGFLGVVLEAKYTNVDARLENVFSTEFTSVKAPIPAVGLIGRGYVFPNVSVTGEFTGFKLPGSIANLDENDTGSYYDFDVYGTLNFTNNVGVMAGYRRLTVNYRIDDDYGDFQLKGFYLQGVVRF